MKNFSKNNYSKNNSSGNYKRSQSKNNNNQGDKVNSSKNNYERYKSNKKDEFNKRDDFKGKEYSYLKSKEKLRNNFYHSQSRFSPKNFNKDNNSANAQEKPQLNPNDKNFDDWIWGKHSVFAALTSDRPINRIWCTSEIFSSEKFFLLLKEHKSKGVLIEEVSWSRLSQLTCGAVHQGVSLQLASSKTISLDKLIDISKSKSSNPILVALDGVTDPHNLGAIIRSAEAFDCKGIIIPQRRSAGLTGTVAKVAAGALEHIPVSRVVNLNRTINELKKKGFIIIGLSGDGKVPISEFNEKAPFLVIVGAENKGISLLTQKNCDYLLKIPLKGKTSSLNASVAAAISLCYLSNN
tara:strand:- start:94 stop:1146 length:1053 start_codon:yes stop_codon:yes gene_type:complete